MEELIKEETMKKIPCAIYDRVCGYYAPVNLTSNPGKTEEIKQRNEKRVDVKEALEKVIK